MQGAASSFLQLQPTSQGAQGPGFATSTATLHRPITTYMRPIRPAPRGVCDCCRRWPGARSIRDSQAPVGLVDFLCSCCCCCLRRGGRGLGMYLVTTVIIYLDLILYCIGHICVINSISRKSNTQLTCTRVLVGIYMHHFWVWHIGLLNGAGLLFCTRNLNFAYCYCFFAPWSPLLSGD